VILEQVTNGVAVRMAVLFRASGLDPGAIETEEEKDETQDEEGPAAEGKDAATSAKSLRTNGGGRPRGARARTTVTTGNGGSSDE
jgi:hypothetical protein